MRAPTLKECKIRGHQHPEALCDQPVWTAQVRAKARLVEIIIKCTARKISYGNEVAIPQDSADFPPEPTARRVEGCVLHKVSGAREGLPRSIESFIPIRKSSHLYQLRFFRDAMPFTYLAGRA